MTHVVTHAIPCRKQAVDQLPRIPSRVERQVRDPARHGRHYLRHVTRQVISAPYMQVQYSWQVSTLRIRYPKSLQVKKILSLAIYITAENLQQL
jgi:hypothetical protein